MKAQGTELKDARIVFFGAGSSAVGVAKSISSVIELKGGLSAEEAKKVTYPGIPCSAGSHPHHPGSYLRWYWRHLADSTLRSQCPSRVTC